MVWVLVGFHWGVGNWFGLGRALFHPPPKVYSGVIRLDGLANRRAEVLSEARFGKLVKAAFARRRKQLLNSLKSDPTLGEPPSLLEALRRANIDPTRRADTLSVQEFAAPERPLG